MSEFPSIKNNTESGFTEAAIVGMFNGVVKTMDKLEKTLVDILDHDNDDRDEE
jgi:hypothetical protein